MEIIKTALQILIRTKKTTLPILLTHCTSASMGESSQKLNLAYTPLFQPLHLRHRVGWLVVMPELAEVDYFRKQWNPGLDTPILEVLLHPKARVFRGTETELLIEILPLTILKESRSHGKQMLFIAENSRAHSIKFWLGLHLGMTGKLSCESPDFKPNKHDHLVLKQEHQSLVFTDPRLFGRVLFAQSPDAPSWWSSLPPELLSPGFTLARMTEFLQRRGRAPIKAVLLMQERFPGIGNWMADEILWRAEILPRRPAGSLTSTENKKLFREIQRVCRDAMKIIGTTWGDPPDSWLFNHRWKKGGICPKTGFPLIYETIGGRTTCYSPACQF